MLPQLLGLTTPGDIVLSEPAVLPELTLATGTEGGDSAGMVGTLSVPEGLLALPWAGSTSGDVSMTASSDDRVLPHVVAGKAASPRTPLLSVGGTAEARSVEGAFASLLNCTGPSFVGLADACRNSVEDIDRRKGEANPW